MTHTLDELYAQWRAVAAHNGNITLQIFPVDGEELYSVWIERAGAPQILIGAGVHGDEPVSPWALLSVVRDGLLDPRFGYRLWCCMNPQGYRRGTRENARGQDINRSYTEAPLTAEASCIVAHSLESPYVFALDLHEDYEAQGVYLYEPVVDGTAPYGRAVLDAMEADGFALQRDFHAFDLGYPIESAEAMRQLEPGRVLPDIAREIEHFRAGLPLSMFCLMSGRAQRTITFESPKQCAWDDRIAMHRIAITQTLAQVGA